MTPPLPRPVARGFTLLELLIVIGLVAALSVAVVGVLGAGRGPALQSAQGTVANLVVAARARAVAAHQPTRLLIQFDPAGEDAPARFLRQIVLQEQVDGAWQSIADAVLPEGTYVVPGNFAAPDGLFAAADGAWTKGDGSSLRSTALRGTNLVTVAVYAAAAEQWMSLPFAAVGTTNAAGDLVLAAGRRRALGSGGAPVELTNPDEVRGLSLSTYGIATFVDGRASF